MTQLRTWWRKLGGLMVVCLLASLVAGPALDAFVCKDEIGAVASSAAEDPSDASAPHDPSTPAHTDADVCVHGHCHHGVTFALTLAEGVAPPRAITLAHTLEAGAVRVSRSPGGLERPPRA